MIYIKKGAPPTSVAIKVAEIKRNPSWRDIPEVRPEDPEAQLGYGSTLRSYFEQLPKDDLREAMLKEQHYLCAYCMRSLPNKESVRIEHWYPLSKARDTAIDYQNLLAVCEGVYSDQQQRQPCCDNSKSGKEIQLDPRNQAMMDHIQYESNGTLYFDAPTWMGQDDKKTIDSDIKDTLRLNGMDSELTIGRRIVWNRSRDLLDSLRKKGKCTASNVELLIQKIEEQEKYPQYAGVMLFYYKRWLRNHSK